MTNQLNFVSPPGGNVVMEELLAVVADAVQAAGGSATLHRGRIEDVVDRDCTPVVVPHEYMALFPGTADEVLRRCVGFGVEHPGTASFEAAAGLAPRFGGWFEIGADSVKVVRQRGVRCERFVLGYSRLWDQQRDLAGQRPIDAVFLGAADESRLKVLAAAAADLSDLATEFYIPPHEWMVRSRPYFLVGSEKWSVLARSKLLLNIHRERTAAFEWVRALEAICNGCVVLTEPSTGLDPLVPGEHVLVATPERLGRTARSALREPEYLSEIAARSIDICKQTLDMSSSASMLIDVAATIASAPFRAPPGRPSPGLPRARGVLTVWMPENRVLPREPGLTDPRALRLLRDIEIRSCRSTPTVVTDDVGAADLDVVCVHSAGDGPLSVTLKSLSDPRRRIALHLATNTGDHSGGVAGVAGGHIAAVASFIDFDIPVTRGAARNKLVESGSASHILVLDSGDELLSGTLDSVWEAIDTNPSADLIYPMASLGSEMVVNVMVPEAARLAKHAYLTRGFVARRQYLESIGGFAEDAVLEGFIDHDLLYRAATAGASTIFLRRVGIRLWQQHPNLTLADVDPTSTRELLETRAHGGERKHDRASP